MEKQDVIPELTQDQCEKGDEEQDDEVGIDSEKLLAKAAWGTGGVELVQENMRLG